MSTLGDEETERPEKPTVVTVAAWFYHHVAALVGAFALLAFLTNFVDFDWRGLLASLIGMWDDYVRPPVRFLLHYVIEVPAGWVGWDFQLLQWQRDYLAVGVVLFASMLRTFAAEQGWRKTLEVDDFSWSVTILFPIPLAVLVLMWPATILIFLMMSIGLIPAGEPAGLTALRTLSPLIYAAALVAVNYLLL